MKFVFSSRTGRVVVGLLALGGAGVLVNEFREGRTGPGVEVATPQPPSSDRSLQTEPTEFFAPLQRARRQGRPAFANSLPHPFLAIRVDSRQETLIAENRQNGLRVHFLDNGEVQLGPSSPEQSWQGTMRFGKQSAPPRRIDDRRVEIPHAGGITEWFVNGERGLEHGFIVSAKAAEDLRSANNSLELPVSLHGLVAKCDPDSRGDLLFADQNGTPAVSYRNLKVWDAKGQILKSEMTPSEDGFLLAINDETATYPITIDPVLVSYQSNFSAPFPTYIYLWDFAISGDRLVTGWGNDIGENEHGLIYRREGERWIQEVSYRPAQIYAVAIDGDTAAFADSDGIRVYRLFENAGSQWLLEDDISHPNGLDQRGTLAVSGDTIIGATSSGVRVYTRSGGNWTLQANLPPATEIHLDGDTALLDSDVYVRSNSNWSLQQSLPLAVNRALSGDTILIGGTIYTRVGGTWILQSQLPVQSGTLALSGDQIATVENHPLGAKLTVFARVGDNWQAQPLTRLIAYSCYRWKADIVCDEHLTTDRAAAMEIRMAGNTVVVQSWGLGDGRAVETFVLNPSELSVQPVEVEESRGMVDIPFTLSVPATAEITIEYATAEYSAGEGDDFTDSQGTLTIPIGESVATLQIPIVDDQLAEEDEVFFVLLSNAQGISLPDGIRIPVTILDDDSLELTVLDASVTEGDTLTFNVELSRPAGHDVSFTFRVVGGSADGDDYTLGNLSVQIPAPNTRATIVVPTTDDPWVEEDETITLELYDFVGVGITEPRQVVGTILENDDPEPTVSFFGWQWPHNANLAGDLSYTDYLMKEGDLVAAYNFGHGIPGTVEQIDGIPFLNTGGIVGNPSGTAPGSISYEVSGLDTPEDGLDHLGIDPLFFSEVQGVSGKLRVNGLNPLRNYVVQIFHGEPRAIEATDWAVGGTINLASDNTGVLGGGALGNGIAGEDPAARTDRRILTFGLMARTTFSYEIHGWTDKPASIAGFQIRQVSNFPDSPELGAGSGPTEDLNGDGFPNLIHTALRIPLDVSIPQQHPALILQPDFDFIPARTTYLVDLPVIPVEGITIGIEESIDGLTWTELARRTGTGLWSWHVDAFGVFFNTHDGYQQVGVLSLAASNPAALFRMTATIETP